MTVEGLDQYAPAPEPLEQPAWMTRGEGLWAAVDGTCQPVSADGAASGRLEVTTCLDADLTCGVTLTAQGDATLDLAWCRRDDQRVTGFVDDVVLRLVAATADHAVYRQLVSLTVVPMGRRGAWQRCSGDSLRQLERQQGKKQRSMVAPDGGDVRFDGPKAGLRHCKSCSMASA